MINDFKMVISTDDLLRIINKGVAELVPGCFGKLIQSTDKVTRIEYSRSNKQYTLVFQSGKKVKVAGGDRQWSKFGY